MISIKTIFKNPGGKESAQGQIIQIKFLRKTEERILLLGIMQLKINQHCKQLVFFLNSSSS